MAFWHLPIKTQKCFPKRQPADGLCNFRETCSNSNNSFWDTWTVPPMLSTLNFPWGLQGSSSNTHAHSRCSSLKQQNKKQLSPASSKANFYKYILWNKAQSSGKPQLSDHCFCHSFIQFFLKHKVKAHVSIPKEPDWIHNSTHMLQLFATASKIKFKTLSTYWL